MGAWATLWFVEIKEATHNFTLIHYVEYHFRIVIIYELKWLIGLISSLNMSHSQPRCLYCNCQTILHISKNLFFFECTKYFNVDCYFVQDEILKDNIWLTYVSTTTQLVNTWSCLVYVRPVLFFSFYLFLVQITHTFHYSSWVGSLWMTKLFRWNKKKVKWSSGLVPSLCIIFYQTTFNLKEAFELKEIKIIKQLLLYF